MNQILGIGHDLIEIERIKKVHERHGEHFLNRVFTSVEISYCLSFKNPYPSLAARFAAKEAASKAFGLGIGKEIKWHDLEIKRDPRGKPYFKLSSSLLSRFPSANLLLSLSHTKEMASAFVVWTV